MVEPSEPVARALKVNCPVTVDPLSMKLPRTVKLPVKLARVGSSSGTAVRVPVEVKVAWTRPSSNVVSCSTTLLVVVMMYGVPCSHPGRVPTNVSTRRYVSVDVFGGPLWRWGRRGGQGDL